jgi:hypothetical protein
MSTRMLLHYFLGTAVIILETAVYIKYKKNESGIFNIVPHLHTSLGKNFYIIIKCRQKKIILRKKQVNGVQVCLVQEKL